MGECFICWEVMWRERSECYYDPCLEISLQNCCFTEHGDLLVSLFKSKTDCQHSCSGDDDDDDDDDAEAAQQSL
jgi:hypothetical protein